MSTYTWQQVGQNQKNGWLVIDGVIYDPTPYLNEHPGGPAVLQNRFGKDATRDFNETGEEFNNNVGHTSGARQILEKYKIGTVDKNSPQEQWQAGGGTPANAQQFAFLIVAIVIVFILWNVFAK
ncbi:unnamed protein product (macronuclear) [Paramecium tetraurelia]|uniref:Cytochrome b5 heme-binding domain-containing protein n=1 Tax=Paramecium tetraurelia TaxID=5888 RepID=A0CG07_PARTE|nr:uncharacterized protein GSPATT00038167001 [Paramecium tetraurelia]CAK69724.1 unnamed protein product [Paramecium tetraurelia]|eukprot:XP_001437121.1 hypothetical protein (macronuclear) [Paramecium tetraurelia strain d4-2]